MALVPGTGPAPAPQLRPIRPDAGLLVHDDRLRRAGMLAEWRAALNRQPWRGQGAGRAGCGGGRGLCGVALHVRSRPERMFP